MPAHLCWCSSNRTSASPCKEPHSPLILGRALVHLARPSHQQAKSDEEKEGAEDTIRIRIWRALASGDELSLSQLGQAVGERRFGELRSHLGHVERQAKTLRNKSDDWKVRRGLLPDSQSNDNDPSPFASKAKVRLKTRKGKKNEILVKLA